MQLMITFNTMTWYITKPLLHLQFGSLEAAQIGDVLWKNARNVDTVET